MLQFKHRLDLALGPKFFHLRCLSKNLCLGLVCFPESSFQEIIFQIFLCLFVIRKVGQRKTLSGQRKHFPVNFSQKKKLTWFSGMCFPFSCVCFPESGFRESTFQTFLCLFASRKVLVNGKHFPVKGKFSLVFRKVFS